MSVAALAARAPRVGRARFREEAVAIGDELVRTAIWSGKACNWLTRRIPYPATWRPGSRPIVEPLEAGIHSGVGGVATFLARLARVTRREEHATAAAGAARAAIRLMPALQRGQRISYGAGVIGVAYAALEASRVAEDALLEAEALGIVDKAARMRLTAEALDLNVGIAGAVPVLVRVAGETGSRAAERLARRLGEHLLARAQRGDDMLSWSAPGGHPLTGFSHGAAGIAWSLAHLANAVGDERFAEAARGALAFERHAWDEDRRDWRDLRPESQAPHGPGFSPFWCYGAPGQGIARIATWRLLGDAGSRRDLVNALDATIRAQERVYLAGANTCLCHGFAGNADARWLMEEALGMESAGDHARRAGELLVARYGLERGIEFPVGTPGAVPSLMTGRSGVGLFLLRLAEGPAVETALHPPAPETFPQA